MEKLHKTIEFSSRLLLALVLLYAGIPKLLNVAGFAATVAAYGLVPDSFVLPVSLTLVLLEIAAGVGLLLHRRKALHLTAALMVLFIAVLSYGIRLGLDIDCGCFGPEDPAQVHFSGLRAALVRDLLLLLPVFYLYLGPILFQHLNKEYCREDL